MYALSVVIIVFTASMGSSPSTTSFVVDGFTSLEVCETARKQELDSAYTRNGSRIYANCLKKD